MLAIRREESRVKDSQVFRRREEGVKCQTAAQEVPKTMHGDCAPSQRYVYSRSHSSSCDNQVPAFKTGFKRRLLLLQRPPMLDRFCKIHMPRAVQDLKGLLWDLPRRILADRILPEMSPSHKESTKDRTRNAEWERR